ncbi:hypothetical protein AB0A70_29060 [Streptomyces morookaense]
MPDLRAVNAGVAADEEGRQSGGPTGATPPAAYVLAAEVRQEFCLA